MTPFEKSGHLAHARSAVFARRLQSACACLETGLALCHNPYVAYSAGKDSACALWLTLQMRPKIPVLMMTRSETRLLHPDLDDVVSAWQERYPSLSVIEIDGGEYGQGNLRRVLRDSGDYDGVVLGLRTEESKGRALTLKHHRIDYSHAIYRYAEGAAFGRGGSYRLCPLAGWKLADVGAMVAAHDLPLLKAYDEEGLDARTALSLTTTGRALGEIARVRRANPGGYNALVAERPELAWET